VRASNVTQSFRTERHELDPGDEDAYDLVVAVAAGTVDEVSDIATVLAAFVE
jgi:hypothetical protein